MPDDEKIIEAMARASAEAVGVDPDNLMHVPVGDGYEIGKSWIMFVLECKRQLAAHRAMIEAIGQLQREGFDEWMHSTFPDKPQDDATAPQTPGAISGPKDG